ncbi:MAG: hypothetical protein JJE55_05195 [Flavobacteriaceae bacterium]|nr:hypothetical protein [Flavobacteriaceae bacterium]
MYKLNIYGLLFLLVPFSSSAQEGSISNKFSLHSVSILPVGLFYAEVGDKNDNSISAGPAFAGQANFKYKKNLFGISATVGTEVDIIWSDGVNDWFYEFDLLYGREFKLAKRFYFDVFGGIGMLHKQFDESIRDNGGIGGATYFAVPLQVKLKPLVTGRFAIGFQLQATISGEKPLFTGGLLLQYHRESKF